MLQYVGAKLSEKLAVLVVDLNLVRGRSFGDDNVARVLHHTHTIRVQQLTIAFATLSELEFEAAVLVKDLYAVRVGVGHNYVIVRVYGDSAGLGELAVVYAKLAFISNKILIKKLLFFLLLN